MQCHACTCSNTVCTIMYAFMYVRLQLYELCMYVWYIVNRKYIRIYAWRMTLTEWMKKICMYAIMITVSVAVLVVRSTTLLLGNHI